MSAQEIDRPWEWQNYLNNPYLQEYEVNIYHRPDPLQEYRRREELTRKYSWAIPTAAAIKLLVKSGPLVEIGAGAGYWAHMVEMAGGDILAFDIAPPGLMRSDALRVERVVVNNQCGDRCWTKVMDGGPEKAREHSNRALFLCWPPYHLSFASDCLREYRGNRVIYVGEGHGGCTGDDAFHDELEDKWERTDVEDIPQWEGLHDRMEVWER